MLALVGQVGRQAEVTETTRVTLIQWLKQIPFLLYAGLRVDLQSFLLQKADPGDKTRVLRAPPYHHGLSNNLKDPVRIEILCLVGPSFLLEQAFAPVCRPQAVDDVKG